MRVHLWGLLLASWCLAACAGSSQRGLRGLGSLASGPDTLGGVRIQGLDLAKLTDRTLANAVQRQQHIEEDDCFTYLSARLSPADKAGLSTVFLNRNVELALHARRATAWAARVPFDIFQEYVLPFASLTERREGWRRVFFQELLPDVLEAKSLAAATATLTQGVWDRWNIKPAKRQPEIAAPFQVIRKGKASSTALSLFMVNALRAVGIPARMVGTTQWKGYQTGHTWVEAYDGAGWAFLDPVQYQALNQTWFFPEPVKQQIPGSSQHAIVALTIDCDATDAAAPWAPDTPGLCAHDITQTYLDR